MSSIKEELVKLKGKCGNLTPSFQCELCWRPTDFWVPEIVIVDEKEYLKEHPMCIHCMMAEIEVRCGAKAGEAKHHRCDPLMEWLPEEFGISLHLNGKSSYDVNLKLLGHDDTNLHYVMISRNVFSGEYQCRARRCSWTEVNGLETMLRDLHYFLDDKVIRKEEEPHEVFDFY